MKRGRRIGRPLGALLLSLSFEGNLFSAPRSENEAPPHVSWADFFSKVESTGATFSDRMRALDGKRVVIRGCAVADPRPAGGLYLTRLPEAKLHPDDEDTLPWDSIGVVWKKGRKIPPVPRQPSVEGTLRLGNRELGTETVILVLEDAVPYTEKSKAAPAGTVPAAK